MARTEARTIDRYRKCRVLGCRGATPGEKAAAWAAARRMWNKYECLRHNPLTGTSPLLATLFDLWDNERNSYRTTVDSTELVWALSMRETNELQDALRQLRAQRSAGFRNGSYHGPKINDFASDLKMLNIVEYAIERALHYQEA